MKTFAIAAAHRETADRIARQRASDIDDDYGYVAAFLGSYDDDDGTIYEYAARALSEAEVESLPVDGDSAFEAARTLMGGREIVALG